MPASTMILFWHLVQLSFRRQITYRAAMLAGLATNFFFGLLRMALLQALYGARPEVADMDLQEAITFTALSQATITLVSLWGWYDIIRSVNSGEIASDLLKPMNYFNFWLARESGRVGANFILRSLSILGLYALFLDLKAPHNGLAILTSVLLAFLNSFAWRFLVNLAAFWTPNAIGVGRFAFSLTIIFSGFFLPLRFYPEWFVKLCYLTPFPAMVNTPIELYLGLVSGRDTSIAVMGQIFWFLALLALGNLVLRAGIKHLVIQGG